MPVNSPHGHSEELWKATLEAFKRSILRASSVSVKSFEQTIREDIKKYRNDSKKALKQSGIEEDFNELAKLLQDLINTIDISFFTFKILE